MIVEVPQQVTEDAIASVHANENGLVVVSCCGLCVTFDREEAQRIADHLALAGYQPQEEPE